MVETWTYLIFGGNLTFAFPWFWIGALFWTGALNFFSRYIIYLLTNCTYHVRNWKKCLIMIFDLKPEYPADVKVNKTGSSFATNWELNFSSLFHAALICFERYFLSFENVEKFGGSVFNARICYCLWSLDLWKTKR